jgi:hypothetical protein
MSNKASSTRAVRKIVRQDWQKGTKQARSLAAFNMGSCSKKK